MPTQNSATRMLKDMLIFKNRLECTFVVLLYMFLIFFLQNAINVTSIEIKDDSLN